jgi:ribonuclease HI
MFQPYNKKIIDQVCSVQICGYWSCACLLFTAWSIQTHKKVLDQYHSTWTPRSVNNLNLSMQLIQLFFSQTHVAGHSGIHGNEMADSLAKTGSLL